MVLKVSREIGPIGTASRVVLGTSLITLAILWQDAGWWDLAAALTMLPVLAVGATYLPAARGPVVTTAIVMAAVLGLGTLLTFVSPVDGGAIFLFVGLSMLLAAVRGDGGCELLSAVSMVRGRRATACPLFSAVDAAEAGR